ncbi:MAG TPA: GAF domain-containing protein [Anaerolineaceae bacterium]|nr:GAF domain-containing protein [Anaerolineaceae bacterium]HPN53538.1 GAF domain-containing protein [Anaerolineaceae bacterium]
MKRFLQGKPDSCTPFRWWLISQPFHHHLARVLLCFALFLFLAVPAAQALAAAGRTVRVGVYQNKPKIFTDENGQAAGFFVDLLAEIGKLEGWSLVYIPCEWEACLEALQAGQIDLMPDVAYSRARDEKYDFHRTPAAESYSLLYANPKAEITRLDQLDGKRVAVLNGSIQQSELEEIMYNLGYQVEFVPASSLAEAFSLTASGTADAAVANNFFGNYYYQSYHLIRTPIVFNTAMLFYVTAQGQNHDLLEAINQHLDAWRNEPDSIYIVILNRWLEQPSSNANLERILWITGITLVSLGLAIGWIFLLRKQVRDRTQHLLEANRTLQENEERYRLISTVASDYMFSTQLDPNGDLSLNWVTGAFESITGYTFEEYKARGGWRAALHPDDIEKDNQDIACLRTNKEVITEIRTITKDKRTVWVRVYAHPLWDEKEQKLTGIYGAVQDITERKQAEATLLDTQQKLANIIEFLPDATFVIDENKRLIAWNRACEIMTGVNKDELLGQGDYIYAVPFFGQRQPILIDLLDHPSEEVEANYKYVKLVGDVLCAESFIPGLRNGKGAHLWGATAPLYDQSGQRRGAIEVIRDITDQKMVEEELRRKNRSLMTLSACNQALVRITNENELLNEICRIIVEIGGQRMAWIGFAQSDETKKVLPVAQWGFEDGYLETAHITWADEERGRGPTGTAIRTGQPVVVHDVVHNPQFAPWREAALQRGYASCIAIPLLTAGRAIGALVIYASEVNAFDSEETELLQRLASDLAYGIESLRMRAERAHAVEQLRINAEELAALNILARKVSQSLSLDEVAAASIEEVIRVVKPDAAMLFLQDGNDLILKAASPLDTSSRPNHQVGRCLCGLAIATGKALYSQNILIDSRCTMPSCKDSGIRSVANLPLRCGEAHIGVISLASYQERDFEKKSTFLETLASQIAIGIHNALLHERVQQHADELEKRVVERTQELESFTYSVSHDLRAPLRALEGFSKIINEDYSSMLDETGQSYLNRINAASQKMSRLIDDLLSLSRITRSDLNLTRVNLSEIVEKLKTSLMETQPERSVTWIIAPNVVVNGDARLLEVAMSNLLNNAFKFTSKKNYAHIEFGVQRENGQKIYYVRDNGAGFDMTYAGKLFGAFQRLHADTEFEGTGIGLTIVRRILTRHDGKIWVDSAPDKGTTFYFTLP